MCTERIGLGVAGYRDPLKRPDAGASKPVLRVHSTTEGAGAVGREYEFGQQEWTPVGLGIEPTLIAGSARHCDPMPIYHPLVRKLVGATAPSTVLERSAIPSVLPTIQSRSHQVTTGNRTPLLVTKPRPASGNRTRLSRGRRAKEPQRPATGSGLGQVPPAARWLLSPSVILHVPSSPGPSCTP